MKKLLPILIIILALSIPTAVLAHDKENKGRDDWSKFELKIETGDEDDDKDEHEDEHENKEKFEVKGTKFEIKGEITQVNSTWFVIDSQAIKIDPSVTGKFKQKGDLVVGAFAKVEGKIIDGEFFAKEIKIKSSEKSNHSSSRFEAKIKISPPVGPTATDSATTTATPSVKVKIKAHGALDQVIAFVESILNFLNTLL